MNYSTLNHIKVVRGVQEAPPHLVAHTHTHGMLLDTSTPYRYTPHNNKMGEGKRDRCSSLFLPVTRTTTGEGESKMLLTLPASWR